MDLLSVVDPWLLLYRRWLLYRRLCITLKQQHIVIVWHILVSRSYWVLTATKIYNKWWQLTALISCDLALVVLEIPWNLVMEIRPATDIVEDSLHGHFLTLRCLLFCLGKHSNCQRLAGQRNKSVRPIFGFWIFVKRNLRLSQNR